jgi:hypothetical protein
VKVRKAIMGEELEQIDEDVEPVTLIIKLDPETEEVLSVEELA